MGAYLDEDGLSYFWQQLKKQLTIGRASGEIIHVTDARAGEKAKSLALYNSSGAAVTGVSLAIANKNLFRIDQIPSSSTSKGITFKKGSDGGITANGTSTGTYAMTSCTIDKNAFVVGKTYTLSSGKTSGTLYVQIAITYTDGTTDYIASRTQAAVVTISKEVSAVTASVQITASGVTLSNEKAYPQLELGGSATAFVNNYYEEITYTGADTPVLPATVSNLWSNSDTVANIVMEYYQDSAAAISQADDRITNTEAAIATTMTEDELKALVAAQYEEVFGSGSSSGGSSSGTGSSTGGVTYTPGDGILISSSNVISADMDAITQAVIAALPLADTQEVF